MPLEGIRSWYRSLGVWERLAIVTWSCLLVAICVRGLIWPRIHSCYGHYAPAASNWLAETDLYQQTYETCRYSPLVIASFVPFALLGERWGALLWRLANAAIFLSGICWWSRTVLFPTWARPRRAALWLLVLPMSLGSLNSAQSNPLMTGLLLLGVAAAAQQRWNLAALCVASACLFKVYPVALALLLIALYPRPFAPRFFLALAVGLALPFLMQRPEYVARQYPNWLANLWLDDRSNWDLANGYRDLWLLIRLWHLPLGRTAYLGIQLLVAAGIAGSCLGGRLAGWPRHRLLNQAFVLACCWMTLCGPTTESSTYILLAPTMAWSLLDPRLNRSYLTRGCLWCSYGLLLATLTAGWFVDAARFQAWGPQPLAALILLATLVAANLAALRLASNEQPLPVETPAQAA